MPKNSNATPKQDSKSTNRVLSIRCEASVPSPQSDPTGVRRFEMVANTGSPMDLDFFMDRVIIDIDSINKVDRPIPALYNHYPSIDFIVGVVDSVEVVGGKIIAKGRFTPTKPDANEYDYATKVIERADAGYVWQASVGGDADRMDFVATGESVTVNGQSYNGPVRIARGFTPREISFVVIGADPNTTVVVSRGKSRIKGGSMPTFEDWVTSLGFDPSGLTDQQRAAMTIEYNSKYPAESAATTASTEPTEEAPPATTASAEPTEEELPPTTAKSADVAIKAERDRTAKITKLCNEHSNPEVNISGRKVSLAAHAIEKGWPLERVQSEILVNLRASRPTGPVPGSPSQGSRGGGEVSLDVIQAAALLRLSPSFDFGGFQARLQRCSLAARKSVESRLPAWLTAGANDPRFNQVMDRAWRLGRVSAVDFGSLALRARGLTAPHSRDEMIQASFSTGSFVNVFSTSYNAILLDQYMQSPDTTEGLTWDLEVNDYKLNELPKLNLAGSLTELPENGEAEHFEWSDGVETFKVKRFARQSSFDEIAIQNDNLGVLSEVPVQMGMSAKRLRPDMVYGAIYEAPTLTKTGRSVFNATDGNLLTSKPLTLANVSAARVAMSTIRENGVNLDIPLTHLIVPQALYETALSVLGSAVVVIAGTTDTVRGANNPLTNFGITTVADSRLDNGLTHPLTKVTYAGSSTTWYGLSATFTPIVVGYLKGRGKLPLTRMWKIDQGGEYGVGFDIQHTIGVTFKDWRGISKQTA